MTDINPPTQRADRVPDQPARGHLAETPIQIPKRGWWDIARRVFVRLGDDNITILAAGVSFYAMLAIFPALGAIVTLYALVADPSEVEAHFNSISGIMPADVSHIISRQLVALSSRANNALGFQVIFGLVLAIWSAHRGVDAIVRAITVAYRERETRGFLMMNALTYLLTLGAVLMIVSAMIVIVAVPTALSFLPTSELTDQLTRGISWLVFLALIIIALGLLYRFAPPRTPASWRWLSPGAVMATALWLSGSLAFSFYVTSFANYSKTYGTLGAIIVLLMWFFLSALAVILGATMNAEMELQTKKDTTARKHPRPIGERGAFVADRVADEMDV